MHHKEYGRGSNTAIPLLQAIPDSCTLYMAGIKEDEKELFNLMDDDNTFILSPAPNAITFKEFWKQKQEKLQLPNSCPFPPFNIIIPDGTWSQTKNMTKRFPQNVPCICLETADETISTMRKQSQSGRITTAEAVVLLLQEMGLEKSALDPLWLAIKYRIQSFENQRGNFKKVNLF